MFQRIGPAAYKKDLGNIRAFCRHLGNPQGLFPSIHIAGTNGKGSTAHMLAAIFTAAGFRTGLFTSPHYRDFRERIKVDGQLIPKKKVTEFVGQHARFSEALQPSFFEWAFALALSHFADEKVDIAIVETGLGGRLDSTNIVVPVLSVITNIGFDHQQILGDTLPLIAQEKAGIIKHRVPVVIGENHPQTRQVFLEKAASEAAPIVFADEHFEAIPLAKNTTHTDYELRRDGERLFERLQLNHLGDYQQKNLCTVLQAMQVLQSAPSPFAGKNVPGWQAVERGLYRLKELSNFMGRWEFISQQPRVLCDSAHNEDGLRWALKGLEKIDFRQLHFVFGMVNDKSPDLVLSILPKNARYYFAKANIPRGLDAKQLQASAAGFGLHGKAYSSVRKALAAAKKTAGPDDLVFVGGSIFTVAEVI